MGIYINRIIILARTANVGFALLSFRFALFSLTRAVVIRITKTRLFVSWTLLNSTLQVEVPGLVDVTGTLFLFTVLIITTAVLLFSQAYMANEKFFLRFHLLVGLFVLSIILLILSPNLVSLLLGWDGLGVTSYLLVIYFQRAKSYNAGLLTALTNRVGDILILAALVRVWGQGRWNFAVWRHDTASVSAPALSWLIILAARTKRAQIPFSAWLPAAMAAPTPVSSLVHSSTLVTAGVYLLVRFSEYLALSAVLSYLLSVGALTMLLAGLRAIWELDIKKIIALSTLRQLGLIITCIGIGLYKLALFHLLTHAFFKALLFITVGNIIHLSSDFQDLRKISLSPSRLPVSLTFRLVANASLCGFPFIAGFYSKDLIFEIAVLAQVGLGTVFLLLLAIGLTLIYTFRFFLLTLWKTGITSKLLWAQDNDFLINGSMSVLWPLAIGGGSLVYWLLLETPPSILLPLELKNLILFFLLLTLCISCSLTPLHWGLLPRKLAWTWGIIWALPLIRAPLFRAVLLLRASLSRKIDLTWLPTVSLAFRTAIVENYRVERLNNAKNLSYIFFTSTFFLFLSFMLYLCILTLLRPESSKLSVHDTQT